MGVVFIAKAYSSVEEVEQVMVADRRPMSVLSQIFEDHLGAAERRFGVNHPFGHGRHLQETLKLLPRSRLGDCTWKMKPAFSECPAQAR
jgi:hypothetical protein